MARVYLAIDNRWLRIFKETPSTLMWRRYAWKITSQILVIYVNYSRGWCEKNPLKNSSKNLRWIFFVMWKYEKIFFDFRTQRGGLRVHFFRSRLVRFGIKWNIKTTIKNAYDADGFWQVIFYGKLGFRLLRKISNIQWSTCLLLHPCCYNCKLSKFFRLHKHDLSIVKSNLSL